MRNLQRNILFQLLGFFLIQAAIFPATSLAAESKKESAKSQSPKKKSASIQGQNRKSASTETEEDVHVIVLDPDLAAEELQAEGLQVHQGHTYQNKPGQIPPNHHLEMIFAQSGILPFVEKMDGMGRDMLFMRCEYSTIEQLRAQYPQIPKKKLSDLKKRIHVYRQQGM